MSLLPVFIGVGTNRNRVANLITVLQAFRAQFQSVRCSALREYAAAGFEGAPFYNMAVSFASNWTPDEMRAFCKKLELSCGRQPGLTGPRDCDIDLDLLLLGPTVIESAEYRLPHEAIERSNFVLEPLLDLDPQLIHPTLRIALRDLWLSHRPVMQRGRPVEAAELPAELQSLLTRY